MINYKSEVLKQFPNAEKDYSSYFTKPDSAWQDFYEKYCEKTMTKEEILEEAKRRYPIGTIFRTLYMNIIIRFMK